MQFQIRLDDSNHVTIDAQLDSGNAGLDEGGPEVVAAVITDKQLSHIQIDDLFDVVAQCFDILTAPAEAPSNPNEDWRDYFRSGKRPPSS